MNTTVSHLVQIKSVLCSWTASQSGSSKCRIIDVTGARNSKRIYRLADSTTHYSKRVGCIAQNSCPMMSTCSTVGLKTSRETVTWDSVLVTVTVSRSLMTTEPCTPHSSQVMPRQRSHVHQCLRWQYWSALHMYIRLNVYVLQCCTCMGATVVWMYYNVSTECKYIQLDVCIADVHYIALAAHTALTLAHNVQG